jgi:hypothetical protein
MHFSTISISDIEVKIPQTIKMREREKGMNDDTITMANALISCII